MRDAVYRETRCPTCFSILLLSTAIAAYGTVDVERTEASRAAVLSATCGNGRIDPGEVCDGDAAIQSHCGVGICAVVSNCIDCLQVVEECVCSPP